MHKYLMILMLCFSYASVFAQEQTVQKPQEAQTTLFSYQRKLALDFTWVLKNQLKINYEQFFTNELSMIVEEGLSYLSSSANREVSSSSLSSATMVEKYDIGVFSAKTIAGVRYYNDRRDTFVGVNGRYILQFIDNTASQKMHLLGATVNVGRSYQLGFSRFVFTYRIEGGGAWIQQIGGNESSQISKTVNTVLNHHFNWLVDFELSLGYLF